MRIVIITLLILFSNLTFAYDGKATGKLDLLEVSSNYPYSFMVRLVGEPPLCGSSNKTWAYISHDNPNYNAYVSALMATKLSDKEVTVYANHTSQGYCEVIHFHFR